MLNQRRRAKALLLSRVAIDPVSKCWNWQGGTNGKYGHVCFNEKVWLTHRLSFEIYRGQIPPGYVVHHTCRNRLCVNPNHLACITQTQNNRLAAESGFRKGEKNRNNRLNRDQVYAVKIMHQIKNLSQREIAEIMGIHRSTISDIVRQRTWRHISL